MTTPVTGPTTTSGSRSLKGPSSYYWTRTNYKQTKPYDLALPYVRFLRRNMATNYAATSPDNAASSSGNWKAGGLTQFRGSNPSFFWVKKKAMDKLRGRISESAEWIVNLKERQQAVDMIANAGFRIARAASAVVNAFRRRDFRELARAFPLPKGWTSKAKSAADLWLELHFGWEPLIQDIYAGVMILQGPIDDKPVWGKAFLWEDNFDRTDSANYYTVANQALRGHVKCGCYVEVENPNLYKATSLGLVNPASVVWELVPFSFVVDWFIPVGDFLGSFTEFLGLKLSGRYTSYRCDETIEYTLISKIGPSIATAHAVNVGNSFERTDSLPETKLSLPPLKECSVARAATAISLVIQQLSKMR